MVDKAVAANYGEMELALSNGIKMPAVGYGTFHLHEYDLLYKSIDYALEAGYRLFDTAAAHGNEKDINRAFQFLLPRHGLTREDIFIMTKLPIFASDSSLAPVTFQKSLEDLGLEYIDMYMIHFPGTSTECEKSPKNLKIRHESWLALVQLYNEGKVRSIGVSNFTLSHLMQLSEVMAVGPMVNQVEWHPYYFQPDLLKFCCDHNIKLQAFHSFGGLYRGNRDLLDDPVVRDVAQKYEASSAQVLLAWALHKGVAVIPQSLNPDHIRENKNFHFRLSEDDVDALDQLSVKNRKYAWDSSGIA